MLAVAVPRGAGQAGFILYLALTIHRSDRDPIAVRPVMQRISGIKYELGNHEDLLAKLDNAVRNVLGSSLDFRSCTSRLAIS